MSGDFWPHLPLGPRIDEAIRRITSGHGSMRIPPDPTDPDMVLAACRERIAELELQLRTAREQPPATHLASFDLVAHLRRQREFSAVTFGPGPRLKGVVAHIRKELHEIEAKPNDLDEWVDVVLLALDGAWRAGHGPEVIAAAIAAKQARNEARTWPDWRTASDDQPIEHDRTKDDTPGGVAP